MPMAPAPMMAPAPVMAPAMPGAPGMPMMAPEAVMPVAPVVAPKAADDMSGSVGFGVGVTGGKNDLLTIDTASLTMKYWLNDAMALMPRLAFGVSKAKNVDAAWSLAPELMVEFGLIKGASTRFNAAAGLGLSFVKDAPAAGTTVAPDTAIDIYIPAGLNVEHFFTRWFSMGMGAYFNLVNYHKKGDAESTFSFELSNVRYMGSLFIYTD
jgi:hypothetical protein